MGKGGGGGQQQQTEQNITQTSLPKYFEPYAIDMMKRAEAESKREYTPYEGQRLADENTDITRSRELARRTAESGIPGYDAANQGLASAMARSSQGMNYTPEMFDSAQAEKYMSPYIQNVLNVQKDQALLDFNRGQGDRNFAAQQAGAFGGSRQGVQQALAGQGLQRDMQRIQAEGQQKAYEAAQQQFGKDRDARFSAEKMGLGAADSLTEQSKMLAQLGEKARAGDIESAQLLEKIGKDRQARDQAGLDISYEDFIRQRDMPREDLTFLSSILRGVPVSPSTESGKFANYDPIKDLLGTGIAGLGLYKGITG
jgi:hypothetical protein|tara:strand:- start:1184 stop:2122 length:939 start_codon:yes stop_codon:yes gene_type:complete